MPRDQARNNVRKSLITIDGLLTALKNQLEFIADLNEQEKLNLTERTIGQMECCVAMLKNEREALRSELFNKADCDID